MNLNWMRYIVPIKNIILVIGGQCVNKRSLGEISYNSITFTVINEYDKEAAVYNSMVFRTVYHVAFRRVA